MDSSTQQQIDTLDTISQVRNELYGSKTADEITELNRQGQRMQELIAQAGNIQDAATHALVQECIGEILSFYGKGLERILDILMQDGNTEAANMLNKLIDDSFISGLLIIHDLHPLDLETRFKLALEKVRPYIHSHGGSVDIVKFEDGEATIRLAGSCKTCASSSVTLELAIKQAIEESCPDLLHLEVEGLEPQAGKNAKAAGGNPVASPGWNIIEGVAGLDNGNMKFVSANGVPVLVCKVNDQLYAYRNNCPACDLPLSTAAIEDTTISCRLGHRYDIQHAGRCVADDSLHLDPFPLIYEHGVVKVAAM